MAGSYSNIVVIKGDKCNIKKIAETIEEEVEAHTSISDLIDLHVSEQEISIQFITEKFEPTDFCQSLSEQFQVQVDIEYIEADFKLLGRATYQNGKLTDSCSVNEPKSQAELNERGFSHIDYRDYDSHGDGSE